MFRKPDSDNPSKPSAAAGPPGLAAAVN
jgi:hypothetical protein